MTANAQCTVQTFTKGQWMWITRAKNPKVQKYRENCYPKVVAIAI